MEPRWACCWKALGELVVSTITNIPLYISGKITLSVVLVNRPLLAEIQSLVNGRPEFSPNSAGGGGGGGRMAPPRRAADGFPLQRLQLICAVIEKRLPLPLWNKDVYVNVVGGLRVSEPSADLAVAMSVISSALEEPIKPRTAFVGEIGKAAQCPLWYVLYCIDNLMCMGQRGQVWAGSCGQVRGWRSASRRHRKWASSALSFPRY